MWALTDQSLKISKNLPTFILAIDKCTGGRISAWADFDWEHSLLKNGFMNIKRYDPEIVPHLLKYETDYLIWSSQEVINKTRSASLDGDQKALLLEAEEGLAKLIADGGTMSYKTSVFVAQRPGIAN